MATPMKADEMLAQLAKWGLHVVEEDGWRERNRNGPGRPWGPVHGCIQHHTGGEKATDKSEINVLIKGHSDVPGPLVQFATDDEGQIHLVGWGRANHAGTGDQRVLDAVADESYDEEPPKTRFGGKDPRGIGGNAHFYGNEATYFGMKKSAMTPAQYRASVLLWAAVCDFHGWSHKSVIGHREWNCEKSDPGNVDMRLMRADVAAALKAGPGNWPGEEDDMTPAEMFAAKLPGTDQTLSAVLNLLVLRTATMGQQLSTISGQVKSVGGAVGGLVDDEARVTAAVRAAVDRIGASSVDVAALGKALASELAERPPAPK
jgi:hypothetical protein